jgi:P27 family predicted phage terminase small subunit
MNKLPPELHLVNGTKGMNQGGLLPEKMRGRIPEAEWLDNPLAWNKKAFVKETADFLFDVYGIGSEQDRHTLTMLADHIDTYVLCNKYIAEQGLVTEFNDGKTVGPNPYLTIRNNTIKLIIQLMNEMGLTPRSRLSQIKPEENTAIARFLKGPKG